MERCERIARRAREARFLERLRLGPLSHEETTALVQSLSPGDRDKERDAGLAERIWVASSGNPFVIVETLRAVEQGAPTPPNDALPVPERATTDVMVMELYQGAANRE